MNILELDSYSLADAIKFNKQLNPRLWKGDKMLPEVREKLLAISEDFKQFLGLRDINVKDITVSGSNANYSYTPYSDIDLHLVVDLPEADANEVYRELFDAKKYQYNDQHDYKIGGYDVELYVENANQPPVSKGVYSILHNDWINIPRKIRSTIDDDAVRSKYEDLKHRIDQAVDSNDGQTMDRLAKKIKAMRKAGLDEHGELGPENLAFKMLRTQGKIKELYDARNAAKDAELSLKEQPARPKFINGFKEDAGMAWDGVSPTTDMVVNETDPVEEDAGMTWDGVSPTTDMVVNEQEANENILKDFINFCVKELKIEHIPIIKLRRDPQWPVIHKTFGRYINDKKTLEVAFGQRHIMDVLRTVAHELTHKHQHEREDVPSDAGETGSRYENEANARAGVLMRDYGRLHPELFDNGQLDLEESADNNLVAQKIFFARSNKAPQGWSYDHVGFITRDGKQIQMSGHKGDNVYVTNAVTDDPEFAKQNIKIVTLPKPVLVPTTNSVGAENCGTFVANVLQTNGVKGFDTQKLYSVFKTPQPQGVAENASGYIPTKKQAKDPRFVMALTKDVQPGAVGKEANKLKLKTDKQGHPQVANANGLFEQLMAQFDAYKQGTLVESDEQLDEVSMRPSTLKQFANSPEAEGIQAGFEAELIFRDTVNDEDGDELEPDYDADERCRSLSQIVEFFEGGEYGYLSPRQRNALEENLDERYYEWRDEQMFAAWQDDQDELIRDAFLEEQSMTDRVHAMLVDGMELSDEEADRIQAVGAAAPRFTSSKEQDAYGAENPDYKIYLEALEGADEILDEEVESCISSQDGFYDNVLDQFRDDFDIGDDSGFFDDVGLRWMSDVANEYDLDWPYMTGSSNGGSRDWEGIADSLNQAIDMPVKASSGYHQATRKPGLWIVEPDSSLEPDDREDYGLEIVSPPMPLKQALEKLQEVTDWANSDEGNAYTNSSTGLHMGVSIPYKEGRVDYLKLILFLGDEYVLQQYGREANTYTKAAMKEIRQRAGSERNATAVLELLKNNLLELAERELARTTGEGKYTSAHKQGKYIEFRSAGGDWLAEDNAEPGKLENTMMRYAYAMYLAGRPDLERKEYAKKLYKLVANGTDDSTMALFSRYATGEINKEQLKKDWAEKTLSKEDPRAVAKGNWVVVDNNTGKTVQGQEYSGYTENEVRERAKAKLSPASSDRDFDQAYSIHPKETGKWEVYRDDQGQEETLEIIDADRRGEAVDKAYDKYTGVIPFKVRAYYGDQEATPEPELSPRAKLAKRIVKPRPQPQPEQARASNGVPYWNIIDRDTGHVVHTLADHDRMTAYRSGMAWLRSMGAEPGYEDRFGVEPKMADAVKDIQPDVAQNFNQPLDATEIPRNWEYVDRITGRVVDTLSHADYNQANTMQASVESRNPDADIYLRSVANLEENFADGKGPGRPGDSQRHGIPKGATIAQLEKAAKAPGRKGQLARWQLNMRRGKAKSK